MTAPILDMTGWTIDDFEVEYQRLASRIFVNCALAHQWRAMQVKPSLEAEIDHADTEVTVLLDRLKQAHFDGEDENRRQVLAVWIAIASDPSITITEVIQLALQQSVRQAA